MIKRYAKSLRALLDELHECRKNPNKNIQKWLSLQLKILNKVKYIENNIQESKLEIVQLKRNLKTPSFVKSKAESKIIKSNINVHSKRIEDYKFLINCFKNIADGIAFTFINKFDIKPQNFKENAGFMTGKDGLKVELKVLRYCYKNGIIAILNDLTTVLKYNDLTICTTDNFMSIEMKSSTFDSPRIQRQRTQSEKIFNYLDTGKTDELYELKGNFIRQSMIIPEKSYSKELNSLINKSKKIGIAHKLIEPGLIYFVCHSIEDFEVELEKNKRKYGLERILFLRLNLNKFPGEAYYPFSLSLNTENYIDFLSDKFTILIILDLNHIENMHLNRGITFKYVDDKKWVIELYSSDGTMLLVMSNHLLGRIFSEFISPKQLFEDGFLQYDKRMKENIISDNSLLQQDQN